MNLKKLTASGSVVFQSLHLYSNYAWKVIMLKQALQCH